MVLLALRLLAMSCSLSWLREMFRYVFLVLGSIRPCYSSALYTLPPLIFDYVRGLMLLYIQVIRAALVAGLWPNVTKVVTPSRKYHETSAGAVPADFHAKQVRKTPFPFFI